MAETASAVKEWNLNDRVQDSRGDQGIIAFIGETQFAAGKWIGIVLDEPKGKNNGTVKDVRYFECPENHGLFVREHQAYAVGSNSRRESIATSEATSLSGSTASLHSIADQALATPISSKMKKPSVAGLKPPVSGLPAPTSVKTVSKPVTPAARKSIPQATVQAVPKIETKPTSRPSVQLQAPLIKPLTPNVEPVLDQEVKPQRKESEAEITVPEIRQSDRRESLLSESSQKSESEVPVAPKVAESVDYTRLRREQETEMAKLRLQIEQLELHKSQMARAHADLQKQLQNAEREARQAKESINADEVTELQETIEMLTLDKEMAEEKFDQMERDHEQLKLTYEETKLELEVLQHEIKEGGHGEVSSNFRADELQRKNEELKDALIKLRDILNEEKSEKQKLSKEVKTLEDRNGDLEKTADRLKAEAGRNDEILADLREQVDAAIGSEEMVERLTEQNLDMEDKLKELRDTVDDYEAMVSMNNEMIEMNGLKERGLREEADMAHGEVAALKKAIMDRQQVVSDVEVTLHKYRDLTRQLQKENNDLREQLQQQTSSTQNTSQVVPTTIDYRLKIQDDKANAERIEYKLLNIKGKILSKKGDYLALFMPELFNLNREEAYVQVCLLPEQILMKLELVDEEVKLKFDLPNAMEMTKLEGFSAQKRDQLVYGYCFTFLVKSLEMWDRDVDYAVRNASTETFSVMNELEGQLQRQDDSVQYYIELFKQGRLDELITLEYLETSASQMSEILTRLSAMDSNQRSSMDKLKDFLDVLSVASRSVAGIAQSLGLQSQNSGPEMSKWLQDFISKSEEILDLARKTKRPLDSDNELRAVVLPDHVRSRIKPLMESIQKVVMLFYSWYKAVGSHNHLQGNAERVPVDSATLKSLLYSENDRGGFYKNAAVSPQQSMLNALDELRSTLSAYWSEIQDGEWIRGAIKVPEVQKHPLRLRSEALKRSLADAEDLKSKIAAKDEEIAEIRRGLRAKIEEVSELQLRRSMAERRQENASKTEDDKTSRLAAQNTDLQKKLADLRSEYESESVHLRSQIELLESEKRQMEEKLKQTSKRFLSVDMPGKPTSGKAAGSGDFQVDGQVDVLRQVIAGLRADVVAAKSEQVKRDLEEKLPPLKVRPTMRRDVTVERIGKLKRQLASLEAERLGVYAKTALDLTRPKEERDKLLKERRTFETEFQLKSRKIQLEILELSGPAKNFIL